MRNCCNFNLHELFVELDKTEIQNFFGTTKVGSRAEWGMAVTSSTRLGMGRCVSASKADVPASSSLAVSEHLSNNCLTVEKPSRTWKNSNWYRHSFDGLAEWEKSSKKVKPESVY